MAQNTFNWRQAITTRVESRLHQIFSPSPQSAPTVHPKLAPESERHHWAANLAGRMSRATARRTTKARDARAQGRKRTKRIAAGTVVPPSHNGDALGADDSHNSDGRHHSSFLVTVNADTQDNHSLSDGMPAAAKPAPKRASAARPIPHQRICPTCRGPLSSNACPVCRARSLE